MPVRHLIFLSIAIVLVVSGCVPGFRPDPVRIRVSRRIVMRERRLLAQRLSRLDDRVRWFENRRSDEEGDHLRLRLVRMRRVRRLFAYKLRNYEEVIPFTGEEWGLAHNVGCRIHR